MFEPNVRDSSVHVSWQRARIGPLYQRTCIYFLAECRFSFSRSLSICNFSALGEALELKGGGGEGCNKLVNGCDAFSLKR